MNEPDITPSPEPEPAPVVADPAPPVVDPEAAELAALESAAVEVPEGDGIVKLVPLAAVTKARAEAKQYREDARKAAELQAELDKVRGDWQAAQPYVEAAKVMLQQQQQPPAPQGPSAEETAELEEVARDLELYKADGTLDLDRASRHQARVTKAAQRIAAQQVGPLQQQAAIGQAQTVLSQAKAWKDPSSGEQADPAILTNLWNRVAQQPGGLETLRNPEAAMFIWGQALNLTRWQKTQAGGGRPAAPPVVLPPPVMVEPSGGAAGAPLALSPLERKVAKEMGMSESEYLKAAASAPRGM